ncbi:MAG: DUF4065 domain-containing protein [Porphyromonadaceae bacterium]|nr:DUF4065 domain-containing protein [Porphyromonadaceae bacterium]
MITIPYFAPTASPQPQRLGAFLAYGINAIFAQQLITLLRASKMQLDATAVANYFIQLSIRDSIDIDLLGLIKRVYIAHGFSLAIFGQSLLNDRFDRVEAWRYGPVIPSIYHTFKHNRDKPITELAVIMNGVSDMGEPLFITPILKDKQAQSVCDMVWQRYKGYNGSDLVTLTHRNGTPWAMCYIEGANCTIPDKYTKAFYEEVVRLSLGANE